jgi:hypothetical protein
MVGFRLGDVGARGRDVVLGLIEALLRSDIGARQVGSAVELRLRIGQLRFRLGDRGREHGDLLRAYAGIDVVAVRLCGSEGRARLRDRRRQLERRQLGDDVAGSHVVALLHLDARELAADLGRDAHLGRAHDADDGVRFRAPEDVSAGARRRNCEAEHDDACEPAASHAGVSA